MATTATKAPPDPRGELIRARAQLEDKIRAAQESKQLRTMELAQALERGRAEAEMASRRAAGSAMAEHVAQLAELTGQQEDYQRTLAAGGGAAPAGRQAPPPMLPAANVDPTRPANTIPGAGDLAKRFGEIVAGSGADPNLARGGAGVQQVHGQGPAAAGPPLIPMGGMTPPVPGPPGTSPSVTLSDGETLTAPGMVPETTAQFRSSWDHSTGQRIPVTESGVTTTLRPNVLTPGDILQSKQRQLEFQWQQQVSRLQLSMNQAKFRQDTQVALMQEMDPRHVGAAQDFLQRNDLEGLDRYLRENRVQTKFGATQATLAAQAAHARAAAAEATSSIKLHEAQVRKVEEEIAESREGREFMRGLLGGQGGGGFGGGATGAATMSPAGGISAPGPGRVHSGNTPLGTLWGAPPSASVFSVNAEGKPTINLNRMHEAHMQLTERMGKLFEGNPLLQDPSVRITRLAAFTQEALSLEQFPVRSKPAGEPLVAPKSGRVVSSSAGVLLQPLYTVMLVGALALHDDYNPNSLFTGGTFPDSAKAAAQQKLVEWGLAEFRDVKDPKSGNTYQEFKPVSRGEWQGPSEQFFMGLNNARDAGVLENELKYQVSRGQLPPVLLELIREGARGGEPSFGTSPQTPATKGK